MSDRSYYPIEIGDVYVEATISFKGHISATLHDMSASEWISEILAEGDYEYDVISGSVSIANVESDYEEIG